MTRLDLPALTDFWKRVAVAMWMAALAAASVVPGTPAMAGEHWLSRVHVYDRTGARHTVPDRAAAATLAPRLAGVQSANAVFDLVISLQANPQGDDDATVDSGATDDAQNAFEERIREFANAVFEATNGAHRIGRITVYREYRQRSRADVQWEQDCGTDYGPASHPGGFQKAGKFIHFCTNWPGSGSMANPKDSGYALAHEWGHYGYSLFDENAAPACPLDITTMFGATCAPWLPRATDILADSLMDNPWYAASGTTRGLYTGASADYLEFSTLGHTPYSTPLAGDATGRTGHERTYGESAWQTLTRNPATDPSWPGLDRTQYTNLNSPASPNWRVSGGTAGALSALDIRWVGAPIAQLSIDRSGSMVGVPFVNAVLSAGILIHQLAEGDTAIGVGSFATEVTQDFPITDIEDPDTGVKDAAAASLFALLPTGLTSLYDGLMVALQEIKDFQGQTGTTREAVVYILSDGGDNDSVATEADVIAAYQAAGVPIVSFGYGLAAPTETLVNMSTATGGRYFQSPTTLAEITAAMVSANTAFSNNVLIASRSVAAGANSAVSTAIPLDSTLSTAYFSVTFEGNAADLFLSVSDPSGADIGPGFSCRTELGSVACLSSLDSAALAAGGPGTYKFEVANVTGSSRDVSVVVSGVPRAGKGFEIALQFSGGATTTYPQPMTILATVRSDLPVSGLDLTATFLDPLGKETVTKLRDDGKDSDAVADDGTYTGNFHYTADGVHEVVITAENSGAAQTTTEGVSIAMARNATVSRPAPKPITEPFLRIARTSTVVANFEGDDHKGGPNMPSLCTPKTDDNIPTAGRIEFSNDLDCFFFIPSASSLKDGVVARVIGLSNGMSPLMKLYDAGGTKLLLEVPFADSANSAVGNVAVIPASILSPAGHVLTVQHEDPSAVQGNYRLSVGKAQISDKVVLQAVVMDDDVTGTPSGGGFGPWSMAILTVLALLGIGRRLA